MGAFGRFLQNRLSGTVHDMSINSNWSRFKKVELTAKEEREKSQDEEIDLALAYTLKTKNYKIVTREDFNLNKTWLAFRKKRNILIQNKLKSETHEIIELYLATEIKNFYNNDEYENKEEKINSEKALDELKKKVKTINKGTFKTETQYKYYLKNIKPTFSTKF